MPERKQKSAAGWCLNLKDGKGSQTTGIPPACGSPLTGIGLVRCIKGHRKKHSSNQGEPVRHLGMSRQAINAVGAGKYVLFAWFACKSFKLEQSAYEL
ncbi:MAG: hypothetical protein ABJ205_03945 [Erythrobacter sp.]|uniref:hypothetical protein n=1 Tax=Erythrobacter sp. TaxID=1042 RepID=UPI003267F026